MNKFFESLDRGSYIGEPFHFLTFKTPWEQPHEIGVVLVKLNAHNVELAHMVVWIPITIILVILGNFHLPRKLFHAYTLVKRIRTN